MKIKRIASRGTAFTFTEPESLGEYTAYLVEGEHRFYLCDTHLGPESMALIKEHLLSRGQNKPLLIFFSHADWDHIWGACAFPQCLVVAHELSAKFIRQRSPLDLERYAEYQRGTVQLVAPDLVFDSRLLFADDGVEFIYAPGHTEDSSVCYDHKDLVLYAGDLIETPKPAIGWHDIERYIDTLEDLRERPVKTYIASHSGIVTPRDIEGNIDYLGQCLAKVGKPDAADEDFYKLYTLLLYEDAIATISAGTFDYALFQRQLWQSLGLDYLSPLPALLESVDSSELELALASYVAGL